MRYQQLDSLRGLAACSVMVCHATNVLPAVYDYPEQSWWLTGTPLSLLRAGHAAVVFFFVLSGYVLVLPFLKGPVSYPGFVFRRVCRIWIPYIVAMGVALGCAVWFHPHPISGLSQWSNRTVEFPDWRLLLDHLLLVGTFANGTYNPVVWSLVYEMRISLLFPVLALVLRLGSPWRVLSAAAALSVSELVVERLPFWSGSNEIPMTLHYAGLFVLGMVLARERPRLQAWYTRLSTRTKWVLWMLALVCYSHQAWLFSNSRLQHVPFYRDGLTAAGATIFVIFALSPSRFATWLQSNVLVFLGKISYSVYLYHAVILLSLVHPLYGKVPLGLLWLGTGGLTLGIATLAYRFVELPSIRLGKVAQLEVELPATPRLKLSPSGQGGSLAD